MEDLNTIGNAMVVIADKLGIAIGEVYEIFLNSQIVLAYISIIQLVIVIGVPLIVCTAFYYQKKKVYLEDKKYNRNPINFIIDENVLVPMIIIAIVSFIIACVVALFLNDILIRLLIPEYATIKDMASLIEM